MITPATTTVGHGHDRLLLARDCGFFAFPAKPLIKV
jgi:hypothetical protein